MSAFANLTLADGQGTPVNHTFTVADHGTDNGGKKFFRWVDTSVNSGIIIGANRLMMSVRTPNFGSNAGVRSDNSRASLAIEGLLIVPTMETITGASAAGYSAAPRVASETTAWFKIVRPGRAGLQESKDARAFLANFLAQAVFQDVLYSSSLPN